MDFFSGTTAPSNNLIRLRIATLDLAWKNTTISVGQDKPLISPRDPESLAQVGVSPLTAAGNLWDWNPQARIEQRFHFTDSTGLRAQAGVYETTENYPGILPAEYSGTLERFRPSYQGRFEFFTGRNNWRIELAPGFESAAPTWRVFPSILISPLSTGSSGRFHNSNSPVSSSRVRTLPAWVLCRALRFRNQTW